MGLHFPIYFRNEKRRKIMEELITEFEFDLPRGYVDENGERSEERRVGKEC